MIKAGTTLCDIEIPGSIETLVERLSNPEYRGAKVEIWVFDGRERRDGAQRELSSRGVSARIRCAYKPLVHAVLEELELTGVDTIRIHYPVVRGVDPRRFVLEAYPIADLVGGRDVEFVPMAPVDGNELVAYRLEMKRRTGSPHILDVAAPNTFASQIANVRAFSPCGWLRVSGAQTPELDCDAPFRSDQEIAFHAAMETLKAAAEPGEEPAFDRLNVCIQAPFFEQSLPVGHERMSTAEAMHEDVYLSALEVFKVAYGLDLSDRTLRPGQLVPVISSGQEPLRVSVKAVRDQEPGGNSALRSPGLPDLAEADRWLEPAEIKAHLDDLGGNSFEARSRRGRPVWSTHIKGPGPGLVITAGQHANETSGPVGALRAARQLAEAGSAGFSVSPLVNPDGYALFRELCRDYPEHLNHASRFTAAGCDLHHVGRGFENEAHHVGKEKTGALLHMNLHGYPAHEWTRPFTGYLPRGSEMWSIPRGFLLILLYNPGWKSQGMAILDAVIDALSAYTPILDFNKEQRRRSGIYAESPFPFRRGIPVIVEEQTEEMFPVTIITEAPDETVYGDTFRLFHTAQMKAVLAAAQEAQTVFG